MTKDFSKLVRRYGRDVSLWENGVETLGRAFLQPMRDKEDRMIPTQLGRRDQGRFLYLGESGVAVDQAGEEAYLSCEGTHYDILAAQPVYFGSEILFRWAALIPRDREAVL